MFRARQPLPAPQPLREASVNRVYSCPVGALSSSCSFNFSLSIPNRSFRKSPYQYHSKGLSFPLFSYSYELFCTAQNVISSRFKRFRTLCTKHPGGVHPSSLSALSPHTHPPYAQRYLFTPRVVGEGQPVSSQELLHDPRT